VCGMSSIGKTGRPQAADILDVKLVEALDLGTREGEMYADGDNVLPDSRQWPVRPRGRTMRLRNLGRWGSALPLTRLLAGGGLHYGGHVRMGEGIFV
jgi:hypothetical protein